jgi:hypothetical protein
VTCSADASDSSTSGVVLLTSGDPEVAAAVEAAVDGAGRAPTYDPRAPAVAGVDVVVVAVVDVVFVVDVDAAAAAVGAGRAANEPLEPVVVSGAGFAVPVDAIVVVVVVIVRERANRE